MVVHTTRFPWKLFPHHFPHVIFLPNKWSLSLGLLGSLGLASGALIFSRVTHSVLLFDAFLIQTLFSAFVLVFCLLPKMPPKDFPVELRLAGALLNGFLVLLLAFYLFLDASGRFDAAFKIASREAMLISFASFAGNLLLLIWLSPTGLLHLKFGSFRPPVAVIFGVSAGVAAGAALTHLSGFHFLDTVLGMAFGAVIFLYAAFMTLDAYWCISERTKNCC